MAARTITFVQRKKGHQSTNPVRKAGNVFIDREREDAVVFKALIDNSTYEVEFLTFSGAAVKLALEKHIKHVSSKRRRITTQARRRKMRKSTLAEY